ncbi:MAG: L-glutamate gamma-semialdehyde dehydrogenase, partial [Bryobacteraceae bacterium]
MRLCDFRNEPYTDFSLSENAEKMRAALSAVRAEFGKEYDIRIGRARHRTGALLKSINPSRPSEIV